MTPLTTPTGSLFAVLRRRLGFSVWRNGIYIGTPRLLDIETHSGQVSFRTYSHVLTIPLSRRGRFAIGRSKW